MAAILLAQPGPGEALAILGVILARGFSEVSMFSSHNGQSIRTDMLFPRPDAPQGVGTAHSHRRLSPKCRPTVASPPMALVTLLVFTGALARRCTSVAPSARMGAPRQLCCSLLHRCACSRASTGRASMARLMEGRAEKPVGGEQGEQASL